MEFPNEVVVRLGRDRTEFLERINPPQPLHRPLLSSQGAVGVLSSAVLPATELLAIGGAVFRLSGHAPLALHGFLDEPERRSLIPFLADEGFQQFALVIDGAPLFPHLTIGSDVHFVQVPTPMRELAHVQDSLHADCASEYRAKPDPQPVSYTHLTLPTSDLV